MSIRPGLTKNGTAARPSRSRTLLKTTSLALNSSGPDGTCASRCALSVNSYSPALGTSTITSPDTTPS